MKKIKHRMLSHNPLAFRLTILISLSAFILWLLFVFCTTYIALFKERQRLFGYLANRSAMPVALYPSREVLTHALSAIARQLPFALFTSVLLALTLYWLLHYLLGQPLARLITSYGRQASKEKSDHLAIISHELRTPLGGVLGALELLQTTPLSAHQKGIANTARLCTVSLLSIVNDLLDFSRIESGHFSVHCEETALLPLLDEAIQTIQGLAQNKKLVLRTYVDSQVPLLLETDKVRLRQILVNLLANAVKFTDTGGVSLTVKRRENQLILTVSDSGKGIALDQQQAVFTPFYQAERDAQGTGIGLTIAANLAKMLGGELELHSTPGLGTCVSLWLPLQYSALPQPLRGSLSAPLPLHRQLTAWGITCEVSQQQDEFSTEELLFLPGKLYDLAKQKLPGGPAEPPDYAPVQPWRLHTLLVDDAELNREIIGRMLVSLGQKVTFAASGREALNYAQQHRFDLILMDIRMPGIDGYECARLWRECRNNQDADCMIVALSANAASAQSIDGNNADIHHYLTRPVTLANLADTISIAAEYQLQRNIPLQAQDPQLSNALLSKDNPIAVSRLKQVLNGLVTELEEALSEGKKVDNLLHSLKGSLGQAGFRELICDVVEMENRVRHGLEITPAEVADLGHNLQTHLNSYPDN